MIMIMIMIMITRMMMMMIMILYHNNDDNDDDNNHNHNNDFTTSVSSALSERDVLFCCRSLIHKLANVCALLAEGIRDTCNHPQTSKSSTN